MGSKTVAAGIFGLGHDPIGHLRIASKSFKSHGLSAADRVHLYQDLMGLHGTGWGASSTTCRTLVSLQRGTRPFPVDMVLHVLLTVRLSHCQSHHNGNAFLM